MAEWILQNWVWLLASVVLVGITLIRIVYVREKYGPRALEHESGVDSTKNRRAWWLIP